jgi:hypothetical protein
MAQQQQARLGGRVTLVWDLGGSGVVSSECLVTAPRYVHPDFRFLSPKQRFRRRLWLALACLGVVGIGAALMAPLSTSKSDAGIPARDPVSRPGTIPTASPVGYAAVDPQLASEHGAQLIAQKPFCHGPSQTDGSCVSFQLPKVRVVRVATPRASSAGHQGNSAKPGAAAATSMATEGTMESKKAQRSVHRQSQRRNQPSRSTPSRGDVRVADWAAGGYAHGGYGRQSFSRNFW